MEIQNGIIEPESEYMFDSANNVYVIFYLHEGIPVSLSNFFLFEDGNEYSLFK